MSEYRQGSLRFIAPGALIMFAILVLIVIVISLGGSSGSDSGSQLDKQQRTGTVSKRRFYTVKNGDSLGVISEKTGKSIEELQALNPDLDPQALIAGQRIKLR
jgi:hypothetical protein